jgi:hypothetical protein
LLDFIVRTEELTFNRFGWIWMHLIQPMPKGDSPQSTSLFIKFLEKNIIFCNYEFTVFFGEREGDMRSIDSFFHSGYLWRWHALIDNFLHLLLLDEDLFNNDEFATLQHHDELFTFSATTKTLILTVSIFHDTRWRETFQKWTYFDAKTIIGISIFVKHQKLKKYRLWILPNGMS